MGPDIDIFSADRYERGVPHEQFAWLRRNAPVYWHPDPGGPGFWAVTRHADVTHVSRHPELFSSHRRSSLLYERSGELLERDRLIMLNQDPPRHTATRAVVNRGFTPRAIGRLEDRIRKICHDLLDRVSGEADFVADIAAPLPLHVICELLGAPAEDRESIFAWSNHLIGFEDPDLARKGAEPLRNLYEYGVRLAAARRERPGEDLVTRLVTGGEALSEAELGMFVVLLAVAGNETTRNAASGGMLAFFAHPAEWRRLLADRSLLRTLPDEIVRWVSPVIAFRRTATAATEIGGQRIAENDKVILYYTAANRDEDAFDRPGVFDIGRDPNPHVGFGGGGPHFCLGAHLARLELKVLFETLAERMPGIEQAGEPRWLRSNFISGLKRLPIRT
ncbi:cholest-4-en-3-one 26-monooxygenase [Thermocatellispora tengchongensis]|uniref:Cholest-4-en-3-one 26-monooxygenase n=1 Tax=Thermocatellispora tengchongensis TaxID=1073253 RepID=A0A840P4L4_9ACTN|nr:cytochrome P450 [Thermocatellispora tengchongensis]MBB5132843.1 cholest-4-en-3-one 26-monooxygenase [Thermocatellispora tengchongensis]